MDNVVEKQFLVIGAGPGGLQVCHSLQVRGYTYVCLEKEDQSASFQKRYPVHNRLISLNKRFVGSDDPELKYRQDWNSLIAEDGKPFLFTADGPDGEAKYSNKMYPSRDSLRQYLIDWQHEKQLNIINGVRALHVKRTPDGRFVVKASNGNTYVGIYLFMATGAVAPYLPDEIQGIEMTDGYEDQKGNFENRDFRDKRVLIIGKGNSAFETADFLSEQAGVIHLVSRSHVKQAWDSHFVGHLRSVNNNVLDMYQLKAQVGIINAYVRKIEKIPGGRFGEKYRVQFEFVDTPEDPYSTIEYDAIIRATGWRYVQKELFCQETCNVATMGGMLFDRFPLIKSNYESSSVPNMFWIGASAQGRRFKKDTAGFIHGMRYLASVTLRLIEAHDFNKPLATTIPLSADGLANAYLDRMNRSSSLFQMQSTLCDVCTFAKGGLQAGYIADVPHSYVMERLHAKVAPFDTEVVVIGTLKYGDRGDVDAFRYKLEATPEHPEKSVFIHPYFETYLNGKLVNSLHLLENLENEFKHEEYHIRPLRQFFASAVTGKPACITSRKDPTPQPQLQHVYLRGDSTSRL